MHIGTSVHIRNTQNKMPTSFSFELPVCPLSSIFPLVLQGSVVRADPRPLMAVGEGGVNADSRAPGRLCSTGLPICFPDERMTHQPPAAFPNLLSSLIPSTELFWLQVMETNSVQSRPQGEIWWFPDGGSQEPGGVLADAQRGRVCAPGHTATNCTNCREGWGELASFGAQLREGVDCLIHHCMCPKQSHAPTVDAR